jgi:hypothetical protein
MEGIILGGHSHHHNNHEHSVEALWKCGMAQIRHHSGRHIPTNNSSRSRIPFNASSFSHSLSLFNYKFCSNRFRLFVTAAEAKTTAATSMQKSNNARVGKGNPGNALPIEIQKATAGHTGQEEGGAGHVRN